MSKGKITQLGMPMRTPMHARGEKSSLRHAHVHDHAQLNVELWYFDHNLSYRASNEAWFDATETLKSPLQVLSFNNFQNIFLKFYNLALYFSTHLHL